MVPVSIVIPSYDRPELLNRLLRSIAAQTYTNYSIIVVDDSSPSQNEIVRVIESWYGRIGSMKVLKCATRSGAPTARNLGILEATTELIALVDDDDEWLPDKLRQQVEVFVTSPPTVGLIYTWADAMDETGRKVFEYRSCLEGKVLRELLMECFIPSPSVMARKSALVAARLFDPTLKSCQDWDMWTRLFASGYECRVVREVLAIHHKHSQESIGKGQLAWQGRRQFYRKHLSLVLKHGSWPALRPALSAFVRKPQ